MHPNPAFRQATREENLIFARSRGFGDLAVNGAEGPMLAHIPYRLTNDGTAVELHLVRSNPIARALATPQAAVLAVWGPHSYVSPDWYGIADQVPTWNYVTVHLRGRLEARPVEELRGFLDRLSRHFEGQIDKAPWTMEKMDPAALDRMMRMIVPCRLSIDVVDGTWKLGQNKDPGARVAAADGVAEQGLGDGLEQLAQWMREASG